MRGGIHFEAEDCRGNRIFCTVNTWYGHVLGKREGLRGHEDVVKNALANPLPANMRFRDTDYPNRMSYYGVGFNARYVKVCVEFSDADCTGDGRLVTAHPANNMKPNEKPEWPK